MSILVNNISKTFVTYNPLKKNSKTIFENVSFDIKDGEIIGLIGPNGEGKTTLLKIITGLVIPDTGEVLIKKSNTEYIGYINSNPRSFYWRLSPRENLVFFSKLLDVPAEKIRRNIENLSQEFHALHLLDKPFMNLSAGQMQIFNIIRAMIKPPKYLMLDEPTTSLDASMSENVINVLQKEISRNGTTCIWCSHNINEVKKVSNKIGVLKNKRLKLTTKHSIHNKNKMIESYDYEILKADLKKIEQDFKIRTKMFNGSTCFINFENETISLSQAVRIFYEKEIELISINNVTKTNKDIYDEFFF